MLNSRASVLTDLPESTCDRHVSGLGEAGWLSLTFASGQPAKALAAWLFELPAARAARFVEVNGSPKANDSTAATGSSQPEDILKLAG